MAVEEKKLRRLTIKAYHMDTVVMGIATILRQAVR